jgi:hypothetical protein
LFRQSIGIEQLLSCARLISGHRVLDMGLHTIKPPNDALSERSRCVRSQAWVTGSIFILRTPRGLKAAASLVCAVSGHGLFAISWMASWEQAINAVAKASS